MIDSKDEILELLKEYMITQQEYIYQFWMLDGDEWSGKRQAIYVNGIVLGKFCENDVLTMQVLKEGVTDKALYTEIRVNLERHIKMLEEQEDPDIFQKKQLESYKSQKKRLLNYSMDKWISENDGCIRKDAKGLPYSEKRVLLYLYYAFDNYTYERKNPFCSDLNELERIYRNIFDKHSQFHKYGIIPIDEERELLLINPPCIYDKSINKTFFTKNIPLNLLERLGEMISVGIVKDLSVRLVNESGYTGRFDSVYLEEALERGKVFDFVNLGNYSVSRLYSKKYENCMWVVIDPENITFEELCDDFEIYNDMVVTQVIHLQYEKENDSIYITHLDHEFVFYMIDEYENRMNDVQQKGTAKTRMKSFKIDNSKIPFDYRCKVMRKDENGNDLPCEDEQFLCYVLECYFKHKDLLKEYFGKVQS